MGKHLRALHFDLPDEDAQHRGDPLPPTSPKRIKSAKAVVLSSSMALIPSSGNRQFRKGLRSSTEVKIYYMMGRSDTCSKGHVPLASWRWVGWCGRNNIYSAWIALQGAGCMDRFHTEESEEIVLGVFCQQGYISPDGTSNI